jgi:hypothetical protein
MTDKNFRDESFRPALRVNEVAKLQKENPNKVYQWIRFDEDYDPNATNVDDYRSKGWEVVSSTDTVRDDRSTAPGKKETESLRPHPLTKKGRGKAQFVCVAIDKEQLAKNEAAKVEATRKRYLASSTGRKAVQKGQELKITDSEVNESNMNNNSEI